MPTLPEEEAAALAKEIAAAWKRTGTERLTRTIKLRDFSEAMGFVVRVAMIAEAEGHHPDIHIAWNRVRLDVWTHKAGGLTRNDFILAAKIDALGA
jgi:4a-hydroxytetrahydrobiopterin dehydratase